MGVLISLILWFIFEIDRTDEPTPFSHSISEHHAFQWLGNEHECNKFLFYYYCVKFHSFMTEEEKKTWSEFIFKGFLLWTDSNTEADRSQFVE